MRCGRSDQDSEGNLALALRLDWEASDGEPWKPGTRTVLVQNIPSRCTRAELLEAFPAEGSYDFVYLPYQARQRRTCGFAILDFVSPAAALAFKEWAHGRPLPQTRRPCKPLKVMPSTVQGLLCNVLLAAQKLAREAEIESYMPLVFCTGEEAQLMTQLHPDCIAEKGQRLNFVKLAKRLSSDMCF